MAQPAPADASVFSSLSVLHPLVCLAWNLGSISASAHALLLCVTLQRRPLPYRHEGTDLKKVGKVKEGDWLHPNGACPFFAFLLLVT